MEDSFILTSLILCIKHTISIQCIKRVKRKEAQKTVGFLVKLVTPRILEYLFRKDRTQVSPPTQNGFCSSNPKYQCFMRLWLYRTHSIGKSQNLYQFHLFRLSGEFKIISHTAYVMSASTENFESDKNPGKNSALYIDTVIIFNVLFRTVTYTVADFLFLSQTKDWYML